MDALREYKDILGKPNEGLHAYRLCGIAIIDLMMTIAVAWLISKLTRIRFLFVFILLMVSAVLLHRLFFVNTAMNKLIFGEV